jgi:hypothetical protein
VRNPALRLSSLHVLATLPDDTPWWVAREQLVGVLREFEAQNRENAYAYLYWWAVYARHFRRALQVFIRRPPIVTPSRLADDPAGGA